MDILRLAALDKRRMQDFEHLLSGKEFGGCYCAVWTSFGPDWQERCKSRSQENLEHTRRRVLDGAHAGFLVIRDSDGAVVAWTGSGPKTGFPLLKEKPASRAGGWDGSVWSIGCIAVGRSYRGLGYSRVIIDLVTEEARKAGAGSIESYPVEPPDDDSAYRGDRRLYEASGFSLVDQEADGGVTALRMEKKLSPVQG